MGFWGVVLVPRGKGKWAGSRHGTWDVECEGRECEAKSNLKPREGFVRLYFLISVC